MKHSGAALMVCIIPSNQCYEGTGINQYVT